MSSLQLHVILPRKHYFQMHYPYNTVNLEKSWPKMFLLFSHLIDEKVASFLTFMKRWWKVVLVFGKEHVNWSNISGVIIGLSWKIKFGKIHYLFGYYVISKCQNTSFEFSKFDYSTSSYHNSTNIGPIDMFFTKKHNYFSWETRWNHPFLS